MQRQRKHKIVYIYKHIGYDKIKFPFVILQYAYLLPMRADAFLFVEDDC